MVHPHRGPVAGAWLWRALLAAFALWPGTAWAAELGGSLTWNLARSASDSGSSNFVQRSFGQRYNIYSSGEILTRRVASWRLGTSFRRDVASVSGLGRSGSDIRLWDINGGLVMLPELLPISINFRRALVNDENSSGTRSVDSSVMLSTRVPLPDGEPLGITARQSQLNTDFGTTTSRLLTLDKRFSFGDSTLHSSYNFSQFVAPGSRSVGHGVQVNEQTRWSENLSSHATANFNSRSSTTTRRAGGRSLFQNNAFGGGLRYSRGRELTASAAYSYQQTPQDLADDLVSQYVVGRATIRTSKKTDIRGRFTLRRLALSTVDLDTATSSLSLTHRPRFGWSTGGAISATANRTVGIQSTERYTLSGSGFLSARHQLRPMDLSWSGAASYSTTQGDFAQDRTATNFRLGVSEKYLTWIRWDGEYRINDFREGEGGSGPSPTLFEQSARVTGSLTPIYGLFTESDQFTAHTVTNFNWQHQFATDKGFRSRTFSMSASYIPVRSLTSSLNYRFAESNGTASGSDQVIKASLTWVRRVLRRGQGTLDADYRRSYQGGAFEAQAITMRYDLSFALGLLRVGVGADVTFEDRFDSGGNDRNNVRLNISRTF